MGTRCTGMHNVEITIMYHTNLPRCILSNYGRAYSANILLSSNKENFSLSQLKDSPPLTNIKSCIQFSHIDTF